MKLPKLEIGNAYLIYWDDAHAECNWRNSREMKSFTVAEAATIGFVIGFNNRQVALAASMSGGEVSEVIAIPRGFITAIKRVRVPQARSLAREFKVSGFGK